jgi:uncharacterized protein (DUF433 family)
MLVETRYEHIALSEKGSPVIAGTSMKVIELVLDHKAYGWSPEELQFQHPYLTLGQIYSALAYYWDHRQEMDEAISQQLERVDKLARRARQTPLDQRLRERGLI